MAPEVYLLGPDGMPSNNKVDIWSLGMILIELSLNIQLWANLKIGQRIRKVISLIQCNSSIFEKIAREHNVLEAYQVSIDFFLNSFCRINTILNVKELNGPVKALIESCLCIDPSERPSAEYLLNNELLSQFNVKTEVYKSKICAPFQVFTINELYHWWQLAGGDVYLELKKQGLIRSSPPILTLPWYVIF